MEMPCNIDAEQSILGAVMADNSLIPELLTTVKAEDFYHGAHKAIYNAVADLSGENAPVDMVTVGQKSKVSVVDIANIYEFRAIPGSFTHHAEIVREMSIRRKLIHYGKLVGQQAVEVDNLSDALSTIENNFLEIIRNESSDYELNRDLLLRQLKTLAKRKSTGELAGVTSGLPELDKLTSGFQPGHLIFLGAVPKMGKTAISLHFALAAECPVLYCSLEMMPEELADRQISITAKVPGEKIKRGDLGGLWDKITPAAAKLAQKKIGWVKKTGMTVTELRAVARRFQAEYGLGLMIVDQLDKIREPRYKGENKTDVIQRITGGLKNIARDLQITVLVLVQLLDKATMNRQSPRPQYGDIRDSSGPDQDADAILFLWRPEFYWPNKPQFTGKAELIVSRQRSGESGSIWITWQPAFTAFEHLARNYWPPKEDVKP